MGPARRLGVTVAAAVVLGLPATAQEGEGPPADESQSAPAEGRFGPQALYGGAGLRLLDPEGGDARAFGEIGVGAEFHVWRFGIGLDVRLAIDDEGTLRRRDWDETSDFPGFIDYLVYGRQKDDLYARVGALRDQTLGHGSVLSRYRSDTDYDSRTVGVRIAFRAESFEVEALTNDVTGFGLSGGRAAVRPLRLAGVDAPILEDISVGGVYVVDRAAPAALRPGIDSDDNLRYDAEPLEAGAVEVALPLVESRFFRLTPYSDAVRIFRFGSGLHAGAEATFELPLLMQPAFGVRAEHRWMTDDYLPGYFDTLYDIERFRYPDRSSPTTKRQALRAVPDRRGWYAEAWAHLPKFVRAGGSFEDYTDDDGGDDARAVLWAEADALDWLRARAQYAKRGVRTARDLSKLDERSFLAAILMLRVYDPVWLELRFTRSWTLDERTGEYVPVDELTPGLYIAFRF